MLSTSDIDSFVRNVLYIYRLYMPIGDCYVLTSKIDEWR